MLEVFACRMIQLPPQYHFGITLALIVLGGLLATLFLPARQDRLRPDVYLLRTGLASLIFSANQLWWALSPAALKAGLLWLLLVPVALGCLAFGAFILRIAQARSRDGWGDARRAWFALVPLLNLVLLLKPGMPPKERRGSIAAVLVGLVLLGMSRIAPTLIADRIETQTAAAMQDPAVITAAQALQVRIDGPEAALDHLIAAEHAPTRAGSDVTLTEVTRQGLHVTYEFRFDDADVTGADVTGADVTGADVTGLDTGYRKSISGRFCDTQLALMKLGSTFTLHYALPDGSGVETLDLGLASCPG